MSSGYKWQRDIIACLVLAVCLFCMCAGVDPAQTLIVSREPVIDPDYSGIVIPYNIAPLNFSVKEDGERYSVRLYADDKSPILIQSGGPVIRIPQRQWRRCLERNRGRNLYIEIQVQQIDGGWKRYAKITNRIASEGIDSHLVYRLINPAYNFWKQMGIYQRNLTNFSESPILLNRATGEYCMNCHSFRNNDPNFMLLHMRGGPVSGTYFFMENEAVKVNTATDFNKAGAYPSWHPDLDLVAFSVNKLTLFYHAKNESRDVLDMASDIIVYDVKTNTVTTCPQIAQPDRMETFPSWAPDGSYLYFCSAPAMEEYIEKDDGEELRYDKILYDLVRVSFNVETRTWGEPETLLIAEEIGSSIVMPRISPDGRYLAFCLADYGSFPIYLPGSDINILDLAEGKVFKPEINSDRADTFHSWSSNSRWLVFSSKRRDGLNARPYFAYIDDEGVFHKPFVMPQRDPTFYDTFLRTYNVPELVTAPVRFTARQMIRLAYDDKKRRNARLDPEVKSRPDGVSEPDKWQKAPG